MHSLVQSTDVDVKVVQPRKQLVFLGPDRQLLSQLGNTQECAPAPCLLRLEDVAKDVVTHVQHLMAIGPHDVGEDIHRAPRVDMLGCDGSRVGADA